MGRLGSDGGFRNTESGIRNTVSTLELCVLSWYFFGGGVAGPVLRTSGPAKLGFRHYWLDLSGGAVFRKA